MQYVVDRIWCISVEDNYTDGWVLDTEKYWTSNYEYSDETLSGVLAQIAEDYDMDLSEAYRMDETIYMERLSDSHLAQLCESDIDMWKRGEIKVYNLRISFRIYIKGFIPVSELDRLGLPEY